MSAQNRNLPSRSGQPEAGPIDVRLRAFADLLRSVDRRDWRAGQVATRELRGLGFSVCLTKPQGDRSGA